MKSAFLFTANTRHVAQSWLMTRSLLDERAGAFDGEVWVLSTSLSGEARAYLDSQGIRYFVGDLAWTADSLDCDAIGKSENLEDPAAGFIAYRNKRMSKLLYVDWFEKHGHQYDCVAIADNDLYFQKPIAPIFQDSMDGKIHYGQEHMLIAPGTSLWRKDLHYRRITGDWDYASPEYEVNIGFITATPQAMYDLFSDIKRRFVELPVELMEKFSWHDQDLCRVHNWENPQKWQVYQPSVILHLCGGGMTSVNETRSGVYYDSNLNLMPVIVHFGGGAWKNFDMPRRVFTAPVNEFFFPYMNESRQSEVSQEF